MRIGVAWAPGQNAEYRAYLPVKGMERRGHQVVWPRNSNGELDPRRLTGCDLVHVFRRSDAATWRGVSELLHRGVAVTFDNDDDLTDLPRSGHGRRAAAVGQQMFAATVRMAKAARTFTTTTDVIARRYRGAGVARIAVIANHVAPLPRPRHRHEGVVIGWIAGKEHQQDAERLRIGEALGRLIAEHPDVRVECIGVDLRLGERYRHDRHVDFRAVPERMGGWDMGIAPLADTAFNRARSDIKLKEYAASGVVWVASPVGPYRDLGEAEGGCMAEAGRWFETLETLVVDERVRQRLARAALAWAAGHGMESAVDRWEEVFFGAAGVRVAARPASSPRRRVVVRVGEGGAGRAGRGFGAT